MEVAAGRVRAHVVDAIGEERLGPEVETAANKESGSTELDETTVQQQQQRKQPRRRGERSNGRRSMQRRRQKKQAATAERTVTDIAEAGEVTVVVADSLEAAALVV